MNLYRERGVNPASGCVPMLLTLPVLFAFYAMLSVAIELRGAPFVGWIRDLSTYDPVVRHADPDGRHAVRAAADDAGDRRSGAAADDDVHAADLHDHVHLGAERTGALLDGEQPLGDRPAGHHQPHDRPGAAARGSAGRRAAGEERRRRQDAMRRRSASDGTARSSEGLRRADARRRWGCRWTSRSAIRPTACASISPATRAKCCSAAAPKPSTRSSTSSTPRSAASSTAIARSSSIASITARARTPSCGRWRGSSWRRPRRPARRRRWDR